jgi:hypothetical protein
MQGRSEDTRFGGISMARRYGQSDRRWRGASRGLPTANWPASLGQVAEEGWDEGVAKSVSAGRTEELPGDLGRGLRLCRNPKDLSVSGHAIEAHVPSSILPVTEAVLSMDPVRNTRRCGW